MSSLPTNTNDQQRRVISKLSILFNQTQPTMVRISSGIRFANTGASLCFPGHCLYKTAAETKPEVDGIEEVYTEDRESLLK